MVVATVLIVEDSLIDRLILENQLSALGWRVISAISGEDALEQVSRGAPDLILMDIQMPGMGGVSAIKKIRRMLNHRWIPIVLVSGLGHDSDLLAGLSAGADDFLQKPVRPRFLREKLDFMVKKLEACSADQWGNRYPRVTDPSAEIYNVIRELTHATSEDLLVLYEPVFSLHDGKIQALETEVHWRHPTLGTVPPFSFIPVAEQLGKMDDITEFVFADIIEFQRKLRENAIEVVININLSLVDLLSGKFNAEKIINMFTLSETPVGSVTFEITENSVIKNRAQFRACCEKLRNAGFRIGLDDVSPETNAFAELGVFDYFKLDSSLLKVKGRIANNCGNRYDTVIRHAKKHNKLLIAEGIDSSDALDVFEKFEFDAAQGSLFCGLFSGDEVLGRLKAGTLFYKNPQTNTYRLNATRRHE
jgi:EAL domain-containing protein (putative c-di-GMP-specific phosphodiesterase class I)/CheY-like chemotaxis protein